MLLKVKVGDIVIVYKNWWYEETNKIEKGILDYNTVGEVINIEECACKYNPFTGEQELYKYYKVYIKTYNDTIISYATSFDLIESINYYIEELKEKINQLTNIYDNLNKKYTIKL